MKQLVLASSNPGKLREFGEMFAPLGIEIIPQSKLGIPDAEEPHGTFVENALAKARHAAKLSGLPAMADDSGICVRALGGEPGVHSARFAGEPKSDERNNRKLLDLLREGPARGIHVLASCDTYANVTRFLGRKTLSEFEVRMLFQMSAADSASLIDDPAAATLGFYRALLYLDREGTMETFRPYAPPGREWIEAAEKRLRG